METFFNLSAPFGGTGAAVGLLIRKILYLQNPKICPTFFYLRTANLLNYASKIQTHLTETVRRIPDGR